MIEVDNSNKVKIKAYAARFLPMILILDWLGLKSKSLLVCDTCSIPI